MKKINLRIFSMIAIILVILIVWKISYKNYINYEETVVTQQRKHLMTISKSIGRSLELYVEEKGKALQNLSDNFEYYLKANDNQIMNDQVLKGMEKFYNSQSMEVSTIIYLDLKRDIELIYPENIEEKEFVLDRVNFQKEIDEVKKTRRNYIGKHYLDRDKGFSFDILVPVIIKKELVGILLGKIKLENMHELLVKPVKAGEYGYAVVKDGYGNILMHPVKDQIGYDGISLRKEKYPDLDYTQIEKLFEKQQNEEEGYYIYDSYWWPQKKLKKVKKINVYSRVYISEEFWIIPVLTSYKEIQEPIKNYLYSSIVVSTIIIIVISWLIFFMVRIIKNKEKFELETRYLRELNNSTEELRKKDTELHHKRKLETIGTLTGGIAHEFNNVLTPILGYSEMCLRELDPDLNSYNYIKAIHRSSKRAQEIISQIRVFCGDKNIKIKYEVVPVNKIMNEAVTFVESILPSNIKIIKEFEENCGYIYVNETQMHQVIINLCTNAYNAMKGQENCELKINLKSENSDDEWLKEKITQQREYVKISFEDNGCGMEKEILDKIFEPFFTQKLSQSSSGLGLTIVSGIVKKSGGLIRVESEKDGGSKFTIYIPKTNKKIDELIDTREKLELKGYERVLVVDNDEVIVNMIRNGLETFGYMVRGVTDGKEILKEFSYIKDHTDIVITDLTMPDINGIQFAKKLKAEKPDMKIILMTAYSEEPLEKYMELNIIDKYLMKPVSATELSRIIRELMSKN